MKTLASFLRKTDSNRGILAATVASLVIGMLDGLGAVFGGSYNVGKVKLSLVIICCSIMCGCIGMLFGFLQEALLLRSHSLPWLKNFGLWILGGPSTWFKPDPLVSRGIFLGISITVLHLALSYYGSYWSLTRFHRPIFVAGGSVVSMVLVTVILTYISILVSGQLLRFFRVTEKILRPGVLLSVVLVAGIFAPAYVLHIHNNALLTVNKLGPMLGLLWVGLNFALLVVFRKLSSARCLSLATGLVLTCVSGIPAVSAIMNRHPMEAGIISSKTFFAGQMVRVLHKLLDADRDGYSPYFGGRDCNDRNPSIHPLRAETVGNGIDENCSGADAPRARQRIDNHLHEMQGIPSGADLPSIVLVSIDAMRPDHMSLYGYHRATTPNIDRFAANSAYFSQTYCSAPYSVGSLASIWTGRYFSEDATTTLSSQLAARGYRTATFSPDRYFSAFGGFYRGFDEVFEGEGTKNDGEPATTRLRNWLRTRVAQPAPFLSWIHLVEPHVPYLDRTTPVDFGHSLTDQYDEAIARSDQIIGPLLNDLEEIAARRSLIVVIFADHGEGLGEHGVFSHATDLHEEALRVPLIIRAPHVVSGERRALTSLIDLHPTLLNLAGISPVESGSGISLVPLLNDQNAMPSEIRAHPQLFGEILPACPSIYEDSQYSLIKPPFKLIVNDTTNSYMFYDLSHDPRELVDLAHSGHPMFDSMRQTLRAWIDSATITHGHHERAFLQYANGLSLQRGGCSH